VRSRTLVVIAALSGLVSVGLGAFVAHGLKSMLSPYLLGVFETGVTYQFIHTLALLLCALFALKTSILQQGSADTAS
jgi:uncharacterized membrane protein YgdD (TMEM256/DUF423 family)